MARGEVSSSHLAVRYGRRTVMQAGAASALALTATPAVRTQAQEATPVSSGQFAYVAADSRTAAAAGGDPEELGISVFAVDPETGALSLIQSVPSDNPFYFALHPTGRFLYVVNVINDYEGEETGSVESYEIDQDTGELTLLNRQSSGGGTAAQPAVDPAGDHLVVANYTGDNYVVLPINADGSLAPVISEVTQSGSGPNPDRQEGPHPHAAIFDPGGNFVATADLGIDKVQIFALDEETDELSLVSEVATAPGAGPRHVAFNPGATIIYVVNELDATISAYAYDAATGAIGDEIQTVSTVPEPFEGTRSTAEIFVHPSGKFLYNSNRGQPDSTTPEGDAIVAWAIDPESGELTLIGHTMDDIEVPWNFVIDSSGTWLYAANYGGNSVVQFAIDPETGELTPTGHVVETPAPFAMILTGP